jgi:hypothetical protein
LTGQPAIRIPRPSPPTWRRRLADIDWGFWLLLAFMVFAASSPFVAGMALRLILVLPLYWLGYEDLAMDFALNKHW